MEDRSMSSSTADPFRLRSSSRPDQLNAIRTSTPAQSSRQQQPQGPARNQSTSDEAPLYNKISVNIRSSSASMLHHRQGRITKSPSASLSTFPQTSATPRDGFVSSKAKSIVNTPITVDDDNSRSTHITSNYLIAKENHTPRSQNRISSDQQHQQIDEEFVHMHPSQQSPPIRDLGALNLSHISPQTTLLSQLSASPDDAFPSDPNEPQEQQQLSSSYWQRQQQAQRSRLSTVYAATQSTRGSTTHPQLTQKIMVQLQTDLQLCQEELAQASQEKEQANKLWKQCQQEIIALQDELRRVERQCQELSDAGSNQWNEKQQKLAQKEQGLQALEESLQAKQALLDRKQQQLANERQELLQMQTSIQELEEAHREQEERLVEWENGLNQRESRFESEQRQWESAVKNHNQIRQQQEIALDQQQQQLGDWEERLENEARVLEVQARRLRDLEEELVKRQNAIQRAEEKLALDRSEVKSSLREMEVRNSSYDAKYVLMEQALEELVAQRQEEESKLESAIRKRKEAMALAEKVTADSELVKHALETKIALAQKECDQIESAIQEKNHELGELKKRIKQFLLEDRRGRESAEERINETERLLQDLLTQVKNAQQEKERLDRAILELNKDYDALVAQYHNEERQWKERQQIIYEQESERLATRRSQAEEEMKELFSSTAVKLTELSSSIMTKTVAAGEELERKAMRIDNLQHGLMEVTKKHQEDSEKLRRDRQAYEELRDDLNEKLSGFSAREGREMRLREELEWEVERLKSLLATEQNNYANQLQILEESLEVMEQEHRREMHILAERLDGVESARDASLSEAEKLGKELEAYQSEVRVVNEKLQVTKSSLESCAIEVDGLKKELESAIRGRDAAELLVEEFKQHTASMNQERRDVQDFLSRLERNSAELEKKVRINENEHADLIRMKQEQESRLAELDLKEKALQTAESILLKTENRIIEFRQQNRKAALNGLVQRQWRFEQEKISAALSKWVRATLVAIEKEKRGDADGQQARMVERFDLLQKKYEHVELSRVETLKERDRVMEREKVLIESQEKLETMLTENQRIIADLRNEVSQLTKQRDDLQSAKFTSDNKVNGSKLLETFLGSEGKKVVERQMELETKEGFLLAQDQALKLREQNVDEANGRLRRMAELLRQKDAELSSREKNLVTEVARSEAAQARLQQLAIVLQKKAQLFSDEKVSLTKRADDIDRLEVHRNLWQEKLENGHRAISLSRGEDNLFEMKL